MATNPTLLTMPIAKNGQKNTIPATQAAAGDGLLSQSTGFPPETALPLGAGGKAPTREDMNGALNLLSDISFYSQKGWTFQYDATQAYYKGCIVMDATDGLRYECINDVAAGTILPSADTNNDYWREYSPGGVPLCTILPYAANAAEPPYSFLFCEGQAVSRTMYPDLFALIGTTYGAGDGSTTFNLPNLVGKYPQGDTTAGTVKAAGLPNIEGYTNPSLAESATGTGNNSILPIYANEGAFSARSSAVAGQYFTSAGNVNRAVNYGITFDASASNPIYGNSDTVTPPTMTVRWIIKAYDAPTPSSAQIDLSQYASDLAARLTREQTPAFNKRDVVTTSGSYVAPVTGWYKITVKGGGGGGMGGQFYQSGSAYVAVGGGAGGEGGTSISFEKMTAGDTASVVIGAGGAGGAISTTSTGNNGGSGGTSSVVVNNKTISAGGGSGGNTVPTSGGSGDIPGNTGSPAIGNTSTYAGVTQYGVSGIGNGGGGGYGTSTTYKTPGFAGGNGYAWFEYWDGSL